MRVISGFLSILLGVGGFLLMLPEVGWRVTAGVLLVIASYGCHHEAGMHRQ